MRVGQTEVYRDWINALKDRVRIRVRVDRLVHGDPGSRRNPTDGVSELKIDFRSGYRVHCPQRGERLLLFLIGGSKATQQKDMDIERAIELTRGFQE